MSVEPQGKQEQQWVVQMLSRSAVPLLAVLTGLLLGAVIVIVTDQKVIDAWAQVTSSPGALFAAMWASISQAYQALFAGALGSPYAISESLVAATPYIFAGLAVALGFRAGLFNIGAEGQLFMGALASVWVGYAFSGTPPVLHVTLAVLAGALAGGVWAAIPGYLKARTGAHEVVNTIMLNYIAFRLSDWLINGPMKRPGWVPITPEIHPSAYLPRLFAEPLRLHTGFLLALAVAVGVYWLLFRSTLGFEMRSVGANPQAARVAGINVGRTFVITMALSGALAGLAGASQVLGVDHWLGQGFSAGYGFDSIALALLGKSHPAGVVAAALLFGVLRSGATRMQSAAGIPIDIITIIQALVIAFVAAEALVRGLYRLRSQGKASAELFTRGVGPLISQELGKGKPGVAVWAEAAPVAGRPARTPVVVAFLVMLVIVLGLLRTSPGGEASFGFTPGGLSRAAPLGPLNVPVNPTLYLFLLVTVAAGMGYAVGRLRSANLVIGLSFFSLVATFLVWATAGQSLNLLGMLQATLVRAVPITLAALSGVICERSGVVNIAIEGMMLGAAFTAVVAASVSGSLIVGLLAAILTGALLAAIHAGLSIRYRVDQIVSGTVINIFATGVTSYLSARFLQHIAWLNNSGTFPNLSIPLLGQIPLLGPLLFEGNLFFYIAIALVVGLHILLFRTRFGLRIRAVGEHPRAADTLGINVWKVRYISVVLGGMIAGIGGAYFTLGSVGRFDELMTAGRGFIGLAAMIFGKWTPAGAFAASLLFGFADSLQTKLQILGIPIPSEFLLMAPYIVTMVVLSGIVGRAIPPAADGQPYEK